jgi:hypothetical protein
MLNEYWEKRRDRDLLELYCKALEKKKIEMIAWKH